MKRGALRAGDWVRLGRVILGAGTGGLECDLVRGGLPSRSIAEGDGIMVLVLPDVVYPP
jgi:hypothetical protein